MITNQKSLEIKDHYEQNETVGEKPTQWNDIHVMQVVGAAGRTTVTQYENVDLGLLFCLVLIINI